MNSFNPLPRNMLNQTVAVLFVVGISAFQCVHVQQAVSADKQVTSKDREENNKQISSLAAVEVTSANDEFNPKISYKYLLGMVRLARPKRLIHRFQ